MLILYLNIYDFHIFLFHVKRGKNQWTLRIIKLHILNNRNDRLGASGGQSLRDLWQYNKWSNIHVTEVPEGKERGDKNGKALKEITVENFSNFAEDKTWQIQASKWTPNKEIHTKIHQNQTMKVKFESREREREIIPCE